MFDNEFENASTVSKFFFKISIATVCTIVGNMYQIALFAFYGESYTLLKLKLWILLNIAAISIVGNFVLKKLKLKCGSIHSAGVLIFLVFPIFWSILPIKIPQEYIGLRKVNEEDFIVSDEYCNKDCIYTQKLINKGYRIERKYYSWRYAELLERRPSESYCCYKRPFKNDYFFGFLLLLEMTFEYFPLILILATFITAIEYYRDKDIYAFGKNFVSKDIVSLSKINLYVIFLIITIVVYNLLYMQHI